MSQDNTPYKCDIQISKKQIVETVEKAYSWLFLNTLVGIHHLVLFDAFLQTLND